VVCKCVSNCISTEAEKNIQKILPNTSEGKSEKAVGMEEIRESSLHSDAREERRAASSLTVFSFSQHKYRVISLDYIIKGMIRVTFNIKLNFNIDTYPLTNFNYLI